MQAYATRQRSRSLTLRPPYPVGLGSGWVLHGGKNSKRLYDSEQGHFSAQSAKDVARDQSLSGADARSAGDRGVAFPDQHTPWAFCDSLRASKEKSLPGRSRTQAGAIAVAKRGNQYLNLGTVFLSNSESISGRTSGTGTVWAGCMAICSPSTSRTWARFSIQIWLSNLSFFFVRKTSLF